MPKPFNMEEEVAKQSYEAAHTAPPSIRRPEDPYANIPAESADDAYADIPAESADDAYAEPSVTISATPTPQVQQQAIGMLERLRDRAARQASEAYDRYNSPTLRATRAVQEAIGLSPSQAASIPEQMNVQIPDPLPGLAPDAVRGWYRETAGNPRIPFTNTRIPGPATLIGGPLELPKELNLPTVAMGAADSGSLGNWDEATAFATTAVNNPSMLTNPAALVASPEYQHEVQNVREFQSDVRRRRPASYGVGQATGNVALGVATAPLAPSTVAGRMALGTGLGAVTGYGNAETNTVTEPLPTLAATGVGAAFGALTSGAAEGLSALGSRAMNPQTAANAWNRAVGIEPRQLTQSPLANMPGLGLEGGNAALRQNAQILRETGGIGGFPTRGNLQQLGNRLLDRANTTQQQAWTAVADEMPNAYDMMERAGREYAFAGRVARANEEPITGGMMPHPDDIATTAAAHALTGGGSTALKIARMGITKRMVNAGFAKVLDSVQRVLQINPQALGPWAAPLQEASRRGVLPAAIFSLHSGSVAFRKVIEGYNESVSDDDANMSEEARRLISSQSANTEQYDANGMSTSAQRLIQSGNQQSQ